MAGREPGVAGIGWVTVHQASHVAAMPQFIRREPKNRTCSTRPTHSPLGLRLITDQSSSSSLLSSSCVLR
jgi:hypothetical protein